jgi:two-component system chemotaxis response regulator CheB
VTPADSKLALKALDAGACEVISKPGLNRPPALVMEDLIRAIRQAARTKLLAPAKQEVRAPAAPAAPPSSMLERPLQRRLIAIGASTGGTKAIEVVLRDLPVWSPGIAIVQHMPAGFTGPFAARLNTVCELAVREATDGERLTTGTALIAPGGMHLSVEHRGGAYFARVHDGDRVHHQKPAVDVLFKSVAACAGADAVGVLLTGMGADGAEGMRAMKASGAHTIAEDESTCVVFGMPAAAIKLGAAIEVEPLPDIGRAVVGAMAGRAGAAAAIK